jgi:CIC family chloride channel protein
VLPVKVLASLASLATGGSGGRAGPTMQIGGLVGGLVGRSLRVDERQRRLLVVAGIAAGLAALFRTPLGAAVLATEILYRDGLDLEALVPALVASLVAYCFVLWWYGGSPLFGPSHRFAFVPAHLWLHAGLALVVSGAGALFLEVMSAVRRAAARPTLPPWARPAAGGLAMGILGVGVMGILTWRYGAGSARIGVFGGGLGAAQAAILGAAELPVGWALVALLLGLFLAKALATSLTVGSGAAAGDLAPSLVMGGLLGSAFGHAAQAWLGDPRIDPAAFAYVGMATFYGGIAHAPLGALVLVSELAGSHALLVPMIVASVVAFAVLRRRTLYPSQRERPESTRTPNQIAPGSP